MPEMLIVALLSCALRSVQTDPGDKARSFLEELKSDRIEVREEAAKQLRALGDGAIPELRKAAKATDLELASRAQEILNAVEVDRAWRVLKKTEVDLEKAISVSTAFKFKYEAADGNRSEKLEATGKLLLKKGNRVNVGLKLLNNGQPMDLGFISDGKRMCFRTDQHMEYRDTPKQFESNLRIVLFRLGMGYPLVPGRQELFDGWEEEGGDCKQIFPTTKPSLSEIGKNSQALAFNVNDVKRKVTREVKVSIDLNTGCLFERSVIVMRGSERLALVETYEDFLLTADIPDEKFLIPHDK